MRIADETYVSVWDPFERVFHWGPVAGFTLSYFTEQAEQ